MDLYHHPNPPFTGWIIDNHLLEENFVVVDIGCQGGEHPRWSFLGDRLDFHGFDPIGEVITGLQREHRTGRTYYELALGNEDGEREFFVPTNSFSASFYHAGDTLAPSGTGSISAGMRKVSIRRLDSLFASGKLPLADYIKLDCEGFEPEILRGSRQYLEASGPICVTTETNFGVSQTVPYSHYQAINEILVEHRLLVFDLNLVRAPRPSFRRARAVHPLAPPNPLTEPPELDIGAPTTIDIVFCRDLVAEDLNPAQYVFSRVPVISPSVDKLIKAMINFELHGLVDCAYDIAERFREKLRSRFDVDEACELLLARPPVPRNTADVTNCLAMIGELREQLGSRTAEVANCIDLIEDLRNQLGLRTKYADWGSTEQVLPRSVNEAKRSHGAAVMGLDYTARDAGEQLRIHLVITGCATKRNEFVVAIFRNDDDHPIALASRRVLPGERTTINETFDLKAEVAGGCAFEVRVGLARTGGTLFLNGDARGPDKSWPVSYFEVIKARDAP